MNVRFFKLGAPNRGERISKYNRLLQIEVELEMQQCLAAQIDHEFRHLSLPSPAPIEDEGEAAPPISPPPHAKKEKEGEGGKKEGKKK
jgi:hypothetical protein